MGALRLPSYRLPEPYREKEQIELELTRYLLRHLGVTLRLDQHRVHPVHLLGRLFGDLHRHYHHSVTRRARPPERLIDLDGDLATHLLDWAALNGNCRHYLRRHRPLNREIIGTLDDLLWNRHGAEYNRQQV